MPLPFLKPNARLLPQSKAAAGSGGMASSGSRKKKSVPAEESRLLGKPLLYGAAAIKSLRINQDLANQAAAEVEAEANASRQHRGPFGAAAPANVFMDPEMSAAAKKAELMMNFYRRQPTDESLTSMQMQGPPQMQMQMLSNNAGAGTSKRSGVAGSSRRKSSGARSTNYKLQSLHEPKPEEDFEEFKNRVLNRTATKTGLDPSIQEAMLKLELGRALFQPDQSFTKNVIKITPKTAGFHDPRVGTETRRPQRQRQAHPTAATATATTATLDDGDSQFDFHDGTIAAPYEVTFGGHHNTRQDEDAAALARAGDEEFKTNFRRRNSELKKFIREKNKEFRLQTKRQERGLLDSSATANINGQKLDRNPLLPMDFQKDPEAYINRKEEAATTGGPRNPHRQTLEDLASQFPLNFDNFMKTSNANRGMNPISYGAGKIIRHAERLLQESAKLQPSPDLEKQLETSQQTLAEQHLLLHQNPKDAARAVAVTVRQPNTGVDGVEPREFDPNLDELQYEPLKGLGTHGPVKLLEKLKAKRDEVLKYGSRAGKDDDDESLGSGWAQMITMNSSILDEALSDFGSTLSTKSTRPSPPGLTAALANAHVDNTNAGTSGRSTGSAQTSAKSTPRTPKSTGGDTPQPGVSPRAVEAVAEVSPKDQTFKEGQDYYFKAHPPFMQMVQNVQPTEAAAVAPTPHVLGAGARAHARAATAAGNPTTKLIPIKGMSNGLTPKMEIKTVTSVRPANVLFKPSQGLQLLGSNPESRTPSGLLDLLALDNISGAFKGKGRQQAAQHAHEHTATAHGQESPTERQKRYKAEKDDEIMKYLRNKPDNIRLFSSGGPTAAAQRAAGGMVPYSPTRGRTAATGVRNR